jgi:AcrR family transcriptional regulator
MARHRPTAEGGYQRGEETRERIVEAALAIFGEKGYEGASTREIAAAAGVNAPALQYYFDNKEGVYFACAEHIVKRVWEQVATTVEAAEALMAEGGASDAEVIDGYLQVLGSFFAFIHDNPQSTSWRLFLAREQAGMGPTGANEPIIHAVHQRIGRVTCAMVGRLTGMPGNAEETIIRTFAINSQAMTFRVLRSKVLKALEWDCIDRERMEMVRGVLMGQTRIMLLGLVGERDLAGVAR